MEELDLSNSNSNKVKSNRSFGREISQGLRKGMLSKLDTYDPYRLEVYEDHQKQKTVRPHHKRKLKKGHEGATSSGDKDLAKRDDKTQLQLHYDQRKRQPQLAPVVNATLGQNHNDLSAKKSNLRETTHTHYINADEEHIVATSDGSINTDDSNSFSNISDNSGVNLAEHAAARESELESNNNESLDQNKNEEAVEEIPAGSDPPGEAATKEATEGKAEGTGDETAPGQENEGAELNDDEDQVAKDDFDEDDRPEYKLGWHPPDKDPLLYFLSKSPMKYLKDYVEARGIRIAAWFLNIEAKAKFEAKKKELKEKGEDPASLESSSIRLDYWISVPQFMEAVAACPCNDHHILDTIGVKWNLSLVEAITKEAAALLENKYEQFWNLNTPRGQFNYLGLFFIGESASYRDLPKEISEEQRRAELRKPEKDRIKIPQEELDMITYKKWWNKQVEKGRDRIEQLRYEAWLRSKPDSDLEFDWDLDMEFDPYQPPGGEDENLNLYLEGCIRLGIIPCSPFQRQIHKKKCWNPYYGLGPKGHCYPVV